MRSFISFSYKKKNELREKREGEKQGVALFFKYIRIENFMQTLLKV